jgi:hypothetical protein
MTHATRLHTFLYLLVLLMGVGCSSNDPAPLDPGNGDIPTDDNPPASGFQGVIEYVQTYGGSGEDEGVGVVQANDGAYMILGTTASNDGDIVDKTGSDRDFWLLKVNATGQLIWSKTYGGTADDVATSISKTPDGGYILSGYSRSNDGDVGGNEGFHDFWVVKVDANGVVVWENNFGFSGSDQAFQVIPTVDGGYFVSGFLDVTASQGQGNDTREPLHGVGDFWGIKLDSQGQWQWRRYFGGTNNDRSYDVFQTPDGGFLMAGSSESDDFDIVDSKGSYDYWVVKISAQGQKQWTRSFGGSEIDIAYAMESTADGNFVIAGDSRSTDQNVSTPLGNADLWVVKFSPNGSLIWERSLGGALFESARDITRLSNGNLLISGTTRSANTDVSNNIGLNDAWIVIIDQAGDLLFEKTVGGSSLDFGEAAIETLDNKIIVTGNTESNDVDITQNKGLKDLMLIKLK